MGRTDKRDGFQPSERLDRNTVVKASGTRKIYVVLQSYQQVDYESYVHKYKTVSVEIPDDGQEWHVAGESL